MAYTFKHGDRPIEGYTIQRAVGKGGFGEVYYAISDGGREVAVKYLRDNPQVELRGVSNCINLKSPHLVSIFDVKKTTDGEYAIIMEYCSGPSLRDLLIAEPDGFGPQKAAFFVREIAKGLSYLHDRGIVHRDLKPGNIFYDDGYVKIGDYGLSKFISISRHSGQTASVGTVHYMAPEIGSGNYSKGVDIYALGVMLYEMLLGQVPFEGSTMAEVLMKHLTTQPEVEHLPHPFAEVIRKALQKDPNDRYPSVDEMVEQLLEVDTVRESLAGFSPQSLDGAVHRGAADRADSPMPSPNPIPGYARDFAGPAHGRPPYAQPIGAQGPLPKRLAKKMERISRRVDAKVAKLAGRSGRPKPPPPPAHRPLPAGPHGRPVGSISATPADRKKRILLSGLLSVGLAVGLGVLIGNTHCSGEFGAAAGLLVVTMSGGIVLARRAASWFGVEYGPMWPQQLIRLCCCTPLVAIGAAPLLDSRYSEEGAALWLGLLVVAIFFKEGEKDGRKSDNAAPGEISFGCALMTALFGLISTTIAGAIVDARVADVLFVGAGVAGAVSLIIQASSWWLPQFAGRALEQIGISRQTVAADDRPTVVAPPPKAAGQAVDAVDHRFANEPDAVTGESFDDTSALPMTHLPLRWGITRAFWGLVAFVLMGGAIVSFLIPLVAEDVARYDVTAAIVACTAFASFMLFALSKTSPVKRQGFWRETLRPFLIAAAMSGIGASITLIAREWNYTFFSPCAPEGRVISLTGLVMCSVAFLGLLLFTGRRPRAPKPSAAVDGGSTDTAETDALSGQTGVESEPSVDSRRPRRGITRLFWVVILLALLCGANATFVIPLVGGFEYHDVTASIVACTGFAAFAIFALCKMTRFKRDGFWRDAVRPFLIALMMLGIGGTITGIAREWGHHRHDAWAKTVVEHVTDEGRLEMAWSGAIVPCVNDEGRVALIAGLVICSIAFLWLLLFTGRKPRAPKPFVLGSTDSDRAVDTGAPVFDYSVQDQRGNDDPGSGIRPESPATFSPVTTALAPHRGVTVLVLGVLGINLFPLGIAAWVMGHHDLLEMDAGRMDPSARGMTAAGRVCGIISVVIASLGVLAGLIVALLAVQGVIH